MTIRKIQKIFAGVLTVSVLTASLFGGSALASETETVSETTTEAASETGSEESTGTRTIVDHTGAEVVLPEKIERVVISSILPLLIVATGTTFAWFNLTGMRHTNVTPMAGTVSKGGSTLLISTSESGPFDKTCELVLTGNPESLKPLSTDQK